MPDADGVWNLVPALKITAGGKILAVPTARLICKL
jgi:hypothetical protein